MTESQYKELLARLSEKCRIVIDLTGYDDYNHDATTIKGQPGAIVFVQSENDIVETIKFHHKNSIPYVIRGAGTGLSGGCVPLENATVITIEEMTSLKIDAKKKIAFVQPGVITKTLVDEAGKFGLTYPPDPASYEESTLAGNVAENAGGLRCKKFGLTRDYVLGIKAVTPDAELLETGIYKKTGFDLTDLLIGSEGTLAVITEIALRLIPSPEAGETILAAFDLPENAARTVSQITTGGIIPTVMEFLDGGAAECSNRYEKNEGLDNTAAILLFETKREDSEKVKQICQKNNCSYIRSETDPEKVEQLWKIRRNLSKAISDIAEIRISEDVAVPNSKFPELIAFVDKMNQNSELSINSFGHAGDGNLHVNFLSMTGKESDRELMEEQILLLLKKTIELGGTLSGEHGIGMTKKKYLHLEHDKSTILYMKLLKNIFDPDNLLNPGKIF